MNEPNSWKHRSVRDFLEDYNWSGKASLQIATLGANAQSNERGAWNQKTVQTFFSQVNWTGRALERQVRISSPESFSTRLSVSTFFQCFEWDGQPNIASVPEIPKSSPTQLEDDLNLNDFSDMF